jgi:hypothetical protein
VQGSDRVGELLVADAVALLLVDDGLPHIAALGLGFGGIGLREPVGGAFLRLQLGSGAGPFSVFERDVLPGLD